MKEMVGHLSALLLACACSLAFFPGTGFGQDLVEAADEKKGPAEWELRSKDVHGVRAVEIRAIAAGPTYGGGPMRTFLLGDEYRNVWTARIDMPVLDMSATAGGLTVTGAAGGLQTSLLFLEGADGRHFVLRKIDKDAGAALPEGTRRTIMEDIAQDQVSALNPYAAFVIPDLAEAAGVLYTAPSLVAVPDDPRLGEHREAFAGEPALLERKVDEDVSDLSRFGHPDEVIAFDELVKRIESDPEVRVDQRAFVRSRLFDMWIGDRDRHDEQYFWAVSENGTRIVPLPIDRDFAFARFDGVMNRIGRASGTTTLRKLTYFGDEITNLVGLNHQGAKLDYRFASEVAREEWIEIARELQASLTDEVIESAIRAWPQPVFDAVGHETIETLKRRRQDLVAAAADYQTMLVQKVDIVATNEPERIRIERSPDGYTEVAVEAKAGPWYRRRFSDEETDEIRVYGLGGDDEFIVTGSGPTNTRVLALGGQGEDAVRSESHDRLRGVVFYDTKLDPASRAAVDFERVDRPSDADYTFHRYEVDRASPAFAFDYDSNEGISAGGGVKLIRHGFRREPYAARHKVVATYAPAIGGFTVHYDGDLNEVIGEWDARWEADVLDQERFDDFYGFGNETPGSDAQRERFIARFRWVRAFPAFFRRISSHVTVGAGPYFEYADIEAPPGFSEEHPTPGFEPHHLADLYFAGAQTRVDVDRRDTTFMPRSGFRWFSQTGIHAGVRNTEKRFAKFASELSFFYTPPLPARTTLALRVGGATNLGDFAFYQANAVGGRENLRGFRKTRFSGRSSAFGNAEVRVMLADVNVYLTRGEVGLLGFYDVGRVWADGESSSLWHVGYGGGVWMTPFQRFIVTGTKGFSDEGAVSRLGFGMFF